MKSEEDELTERREIIDRFRIHLGTMVDEDTFLQKHNQHPIYPRACHSLEHSAVLPVVDTRVSPLHASELVQVFDNDEQDRNRPVLDDLKSPTRFVRAQQHFSPTIVVNNDIRWFDIAMNLEVELHRAE